MLTSRGWVVDQVHRAASFDQSKWLVPYIDSNVDGRNKAKASGNEMLKDFFKLANNAYFGKTMEDPRNRSDYRFAYDQASLDSLIRSSRFRSCEIINKGLVGYVMTRAAVTLDKPSDVDMAILEYGKIRMQHVLRLLCDRCPGTQLLYTDTDSLILHIPSEDAFAGLADPSLAPEMDFAKSALCRNDVPAGEVGKMKVEP